MRPLHSREEKRLIAQVTGTIGKSSERHYHVNGIISAYIEATAGVAQTNKLEY